MDHERWNGEMDELDDASCAGITLHDDPEGYTTWEGVGPLGDLLAAATGPELGEDGSRELVARSAFRSAVSTEPYLHARHANRARSLRRRWIAASSAVALAVSSVFVSSVPLAEADRLPVVGPVISKFTGHRTGPPTTVQFQRSPASRPASHQPAPAVHQPAPEEQTPPPGNPSSAIHATPGSGSRSHSSPAKSTHPSEPAHGKGHGASKSSHPGNPPGQGNHNPGQGNGPPPGPHRRHRHHRRPRPSPTGSKPKLTVVTVPPSRSAAPVTTAPVATAPVAATPPVSQSPTPTSPVTGTPAPGAGAAAS